MNSSDQQLTQSKILLGVTAGIAAYKSVELCRLLIKQGHQVQVVMTPAAKQFVGELSFQSVTGLPVRCDLFDSAHEAAMGHIELARWADLILIAPATADFIAKLNVGIADTLLHTLSLATQAPIALAPSMNQNMWANAATQNNIASLQQRGIQLWGPGAGEQACGDTGLGRMLEPSELAECVNNHFEPVSKPVLAGKKVLITAGPTHEPLDPVRFIGNRSSGKMGFALAQTLTETGVEVTLIAGPVHLATPNHCQRINVQTAQQMHDAVLENIPNTDIFISCAAVADYRPEISYSGKIKKHHDSLQISLVKNPDILQTVANLPNRPFCLGFAAETDDLEKYAEQKRQTKNVDMIAANWVGESQGFEQDQNELLVLWDGGEKWLPEQPKQNLAKQLVQILIEQFHAKITNENSG